jgi:hypothetical protein
MKRPLVHPTAPDGALADGEGCSDLVEECYGHVEKAAGKFKERIKERITESYVERF